MKAINIGIVKAVITKKMSNNFLSEGNVDVSKNDATKLVDIVKNSPLLQLEYKVYDRLEKKHISNDITATRYIDNNLSLFEGYSKHELIHEHLKLKNFVDETIALLENDQYDRYKAIGSLIFETVDKANPDVDLIHESFTTVLNHIKKEKVVKEEEKTKLPKGISGERLIEHALNKFTEKYEALDESDVSLIKSIVLSENEKKQSLFNSLKEESISLLESTEKKGIEDKIVETIARIKKMEYTDDASIKNIVSLHQLKKDLV